MRTSRVRTLVSQIVVLMLVGWLAPSAMAWSPMGHKVVCRTAFHLIDTATTLPYLVGLFNINTDDNPNEASKVRRLGDEVNCIWADTDSAGLSGEHYMNVPRNWPALTEDMLDSDKCPTSEKCWYQGIVDKIGGWKAASMFGKAKRKKIRRKLVKYVGHYFADMSQPMHLGYKNDRGGNDVKIGGTRVRGTVWIDEETIFHCDHNLHDFWDTCLVLMTYHTKVDSTGKYFAHFKKLSGDTTEADKLANWASKWATNIVNRGYGGAGGDASELVTDSNDFSNSKRGAIVKWLDQSYQIVRSANTGYCGNRDLLPLRHYDSKPGFCVPLQCTSPYMDGGNGDVFYPDDSISLNSDDNKCGGAGKNYRLKYDYARLNQPVAEQQLKRASYRLKLILDWMAQYANSL